MTQQKKATKKDVRSGRALPRRQFPAHLEMSPDEWRALKRTQWREVIQAISRYTYGSAYTPTNTTLWHLSKLSQQIDDALEPPDWIAW